MTGHWCSQVIVGENAKALIRGIDQSGPWKNAISCLFDYMLVHQHPAYFDAHNWSGVRYGAIEVRAAVGVNGQVDLGMELGRFFFSQNTCIFLA